VGSSRPAKLQRDVEFKAGGSTISTLSRRRPVWLGRAQNCEHRTPTGGLLKFAHTDASARVEVALVTLVKPVARAVWRARIVRFVRCYVTGTDLMTRPRTGPDSRTYL
jgi:hypothetical protein